MTKILLLLLCLFQIASFACLVAGAKPNILLFVADDLGYRYLGCYGATKVRTPRIDKLAGDGVRFTDAHSTSTPTRTALLGHIVLALWLSVPLASAFGPGKSPRNETAAFMKNTPRRKPCTGPIAYTSPLLLTRD